MIFACVNHCQSVLQNIYLPLQSPPFRNLSCVHKLPSSSRSCKVEARAKILAPQNSLEVHRFSRIPCGTVSCHHFFHGVISPWLLCLTFRGSPLPPLHEVLPRPTSIWAVMELHHCHPPKWLSSPSMEGWGDSNDLEENKPR